MPETHLALQTDHQVWHLHCGVSAYEPAVPLSMRHLVTCFGCQQWPQPAIMTRQRTTPGPHVATDRPPRKASGLIGGRGQPMNQIEAAAAAVLRADPQTLAVHFEPFPLPLGKGVMFWVDFEVFRWGKSGGIEREWVEVKPGKYTSAGNLVALYRGDGRTKWKLFCDRWHHLGVCTLMIGWREQGAYHFERREETP